jgi:hypothetical protein
MFADSAYQAIFKEMTAGDPDVGVDTIAAGLDEDATDVLQELMNEFGGTELAESIITDSINSLLARQISERLTEIDRLLPLAPSNEKDDLIAEKTRLAAEMQALGRPRWKGFSRSRS